jgi:S1-C subfamily serine protease
MWAGDEARSVANALLDESPYFYGRRDWLAVPESTNINDITSYFDLLYRTPANRKISWAWAYILAAMNTRDDDSDDRLALLAFLREHETVPLDGEIVGIRAADVVTISSGGRTFNVHLSGVSTEGLTDSQRDRVINFLNGISKATWVGTPCNAAKNTSVDLVYDTQFFRNGKQLSATLRISSILAFCLGDRQLSIAELSGGERNFLNLSYFLVSSGLMPPENNIDPTWPQEIQRTARYEFVLEDAKKRGMYLYGESASPVIDEVIRYGAQLVGVDSVESTARSAPATSESKSGSGFYVSPGIVLTNNHVVEGCSRIVVGNSVGERRTGTVRAADKGNDLAVLSLAEEISTPGTIAFSSGRPVGVGEPVTVSGFPLAGLLGSGVTVTTGVVSNVAGIGDDIRFIQISAPVQPGNSGGPVLDNRGRLVGIVISKLDAVAVTQLTGDIPQNVNFAIKESVARAMLDAHGVEYSISENPADVIATAKAATVFIQCE